MTQSKPSSAHSKEPQMNAYEELKEVIGKLQRNESQMSKEQKAKYRRQLEALKHKAAELANLVARDFLLMGIRIRNDDGNEAVKQIKAIIAEETENLRQAMRVLLATYSIDEFFIAMLPSQNRVFYEGYGPYWAAHCKPTNDPQFPYTNDLIDMEWWEGHDEWAATDFADGKRTVDYKRGVTIMLPPTVEIIQADYEKELTEIRLQNQKRESAKTH